MQTYRLNRMNDQKDLADLSWISDQARSRALCEQVSRGMSGQVLQQGSTFGAVHDEAREFAARVRADCLAHPQAWQAIQLFQRVGCDINQLSRAQLRSQREYGLATVLIARSFVERVGEKMDADRELTLRFWKDNIARPPSIGRSGVHAALDTLKGGVSRALGAMASRSRPGDHDGEWLSSLARYFRAAYTSGSGIAAPAARGGAYRLESELADIPEDRLWDFLVRRASAYDEGRRERDDHPAISPFEARTILLYHTINTYRAEKARKRARASVVKAKLDTLTGGLQLKFTTLYSPSWDQIIPHDGYVLGASARDTRSLLDLPGNDNPTAGNGTDCSGFIQFVLNQLDTFKTQDPTDKYGTNALRTMHPDEMDAFRVCSEEELQPGDVLIQPGAGRSGIGHTFIFSGYARGKVSQDSEFRIIEAVGADARTIREASWGVLKGEPSTRNPCTTTSFTEHVYIARRARCFDPASSSKGPPPLGPHEGNMRTP